MTQPTHDLFVLLKVCSWCGKTFREGAARHMLGTLPLEQFCTYKCLDKFIRNPRHLGDIVDLPVPEADKAPLGNLDTAK